MNIVLKLIDNKFLITDNIVNKVADRNYAQQVFSCKDRQMTNALCRHENHALLNGLFWAGKDDVSLHNIRNRRCK